jgi:hypothetical protein
LAYRRSTGSKLLRPQLRQKTSRHHGTADRRVAKMTTKSASGPSRRTADHAGGNGAKARGLRLLGTPRKIRISRRVSLRRSSKMVGGRAGRNGDWRSAAGSVHCGGNFGGGVDEIIRLVPVRRAAPGVRSRHWLSSRRATAYTRGRSKTPHTSWAKRCGRSSRWFIDQRLWFERDDLALIAAISTLLPS